ncbi:NADPH-dependent oxidoreductase [Evansella cellulosilytica]|uniref:Nitroreductase n=1 Tax=Evansella cellulosilytica (strain ATCC 21833 / DSM 2522 / FERM P-1141 / JCM 9156 / N-4) TaxID=649639 RepID=E6U0N6_EVAC2|nr:NADPH-dependent oxidoreductase [Evansella cellulosilytica]ADU29084.1 nitroreductase [Evansella cellulosilytica DSM 2522]
MNEVTKLLTEHRSFRSYKEDMIPENQLQTIVQSAMAAANWINGQQVTIIGVTDNDIKHRLYELVGHQPYVDQAPVFFVFCIDFHRAKLAGEKHDKTIRVTDSVDGLLTGSTDVGIAMGNAIAAAESFGLGTVPIGGIRKNPEEVIELLDLPEYVFPISGLVIGYPDGDSAQKPRLPVDAVYHKDSYKTEHLTRRIDEYDEQMSGYMAERTNGENRRDWSTGVAQFYSNPVNQKVTDTLKKQGFKTE